MSHFTVLVIGNDPELQLAPYDENLEMKEIYVQIREDELQEKYEEFLKEHPTEKNIYKTANDWVLDWYEYEYEKGKGYGNYYNPKSKWDWYELGGRWSGFFKLKSSENVDVAFKKDIDFEFMKVESKKKAEKRWKAFHSIIKDNIIPNFDQILKECNNNIDKAREIYNSYQSIKDLKKSDDFIFLTSKDMKKLLVPLEDFKSSAREGAIATFAVVINGNWYEEGKMGWWARVSDEKDEDAWIEEFNKLLDSVDGNTILSLYDCHI